MGAFARLGNELYTGKRSIDFVGRRWVWYAVSFVIIAVAIVGLSVRGLNMGIEFVGGAEYKVTIDGTADQALADQLREDVAATGLDAASSPQVSTSGESSVIVQVEPVDDDESEQIEAVIADVAGSDAEISQTEIGASWGKEVAQRALIGLIVFLVLVVLFIWAYFREWKMSVAAIVALGHDLLITVGVYALSGFEVTPATVTGLLTILGFSLYDTVVVFDKVRENTKSLRQLRLSYSEGANLAVNQTLVRSINTSIVALIPVGAILYVGAFQLGSGSLKDLALALFVGMAAGAYSSIFIATPLLVSMKMREKDLQQLDRRTAARRRNEADRYASVPSRDGDAGGRGADDDHGDSGRDIEPTGARPRTGAGPKGGKPARPRPAATTPAKAGQGRTTPAARAPIQRSGASGRKQPTRQTRSKRGKKR